MRDIEYYKIGLDNEVYFYSRALARDIVKRFREYFEGEYGGSGYGGYERAFKTVSRKFLRNYKLDGYRKIGG